MECSATTVSTCYLIRPGYTSEVHVGTCVSITYTHCIVLFISLLAVSLIHIDRLFTSRARTQWLTHAYNHGYIEWCITFVPGVVITGRGANPCKAAPDRGDFSPRVYELSSDALTIPYLGLPFFWMHSLSLILAYTYIPALKPFGWHTMYELLCYNLSEVWAAFY